jgi:tetratricopeptide (TPR) repeat protein/predicted Ser/Thr protein kinase
MTTEVLPQKPRPGRPPARAIADDTGELSDPISSGAMSPSAATIVVGRADVGRDPDVEIGPEPEPGARCGRYVILERLGQGGMGVVYGAYDSDLDRKVALKLLRTSGRMAEGVTEGRARLLREAKAMAKLSHPNVVAVHDVGTIAGRIFIAMEYVDGTTLTRWLKRDRRTWAEIRDVFAEAGRGLAAAHTAGLVHRDFKPDNVLVGKDGRVRVTDFGLARASETTEMDASPSERVLEASRVPLRDELTQPGLVMGTPPYMAPEQCCGVAADHRMDQFAFCVGLYEALYKRRPFKGRTRAELREEIEAGRIRPVPKGNDVPGWLHAILLRGLAANPAERWRSMDELVAQLSPSPRLRRRLLAAGAFVVAALAGTSVYALTSAPRCEGAADEVAEVWDVSRRGAIESGMLASGRPHASDSVTRVGASIDRYTARWVEMRTEACEATAAGEQSAELLDLRMACLDRRLEEVDALVDVVTDGDPDVADGATLAASSLPSLEQCRRAETIAAELRPPTDPAEAAAVADLQLELARLGILARSGDASRTIADAEALVAKARHLGRAPLTAGALNVLGDLQLRLGDSEQAREALSESALMAAAGEHHRVAASAATSMMSVVGPKDYKEGLLWGWYAEAAVDRIGRGGSEEGAMLEGLGAVFSAHDRHDEARDHFSRAVELYTVIHGREHPSVARALVSLGDALRDADNFADARARYEDALLIAREAYGEHHPQLVAILRRLADASDRTGDRARADVVRRELQTLLAATGSATAGSARHSAP